MYNLQQKKLQEFYFIQFIGVKENSKDNNNVGNQISNWIFIIGGTSYGRTIHKTIYQRYLEDWIE